MGLGTKLTGAAIAGGTGQSGSNFASNALQLLRERLAHQRNLEEIEKRGEVETSVARETNPIAALLGEPGAATRLLQALLQETEAGARTSGVEADVAEGTAGARVEGARAQTDLLQSQTRVQEGTEEAQISAAQQELDLLGAQIGQVEAQTLATEALASLRSTQSNLVQAQAGLAQYDLDFTNKYSSILDNFRLRNEELQNRYLEGQIGVAELNRRHTQAITEALEADNELRESTSPAVYFAMRNATGFGNLLEPAQQKLTTQARVIQQTLDRISTDDPALLAGLDFDLDLINQSFLDLGVNDSLYEELDRVRTSGVQGSNLWRTVNNALDLAGLPSIEEGRQIRDNLDMITNSAVEFFSQQVGGPTSDSSTPTTSTNPLIAFRQNIDSSGVDLDMLTQAAQGGALDPNLNPQDRSALLQSSGFDVSNAVNMEALRQVLRDLYQLSQQREQDPIEVLNLIKQLGEVR